MPQDEQFGALIDQIAEAERDIACATARRMELIDAARIVAEEVERRIGEGTGVLPWSITERARRTLTAELSAALRIPERTVQALVGESQVIVGELPATRAALTAGDISYRHAQKIVDHALSLPVEARSEFERAVLPIALTHTVSKLERRARVIRERMHPESLTDRRVVALDRRCVMFEPGRDGMAFVTAHLADSAAQAIYERLTDIATAAAGDGLTLDQARADAFADLLVNAVTRAGVGAGIKATVAVTVPVLTLLGASEEPGYLHGIGPIAADTARELAGTATSFTRLLTHPDTGAVLSVGRDSYIVPADLKRWRALRDETCRFPNCTRAAKRCDIDHTNNWAPSNGNAAGATEHDNLAHLCRAHHRLKHQTRWTVTQNGEGTLTWVSPTRHTYQTDPAVKLTA